LNTHIIFESVLMLFTKNYPNQSMLVEPTGCQSWRIFEKWCSNANVPSHTLISLCLHDVFVSSLYMCF